MCRAPNITSVAASVNPKSHELRSLGDEYLCTSETPKKPLALPKKPLTLPKRPLVSSKRPVSYPSEKPRSCKTSAPVQLKVSVEEIKKAETATSNLISILTRHDSKKWAKDEPLGRFFSKAIREEFRPPAAKLPSVRWAAETYGTYVLLAHCKSC
jgi:hypothetical protein